MAGPQFVGPTGAQVNQQNADRLQAGLDSFKQLGSYLEAQRQFNEQEKRLNRTLNAQMQQKVLESLLSATEGGSIQEVANQFPDALSSILQTWGFAPSEAAGSVKALANTDLNGEQAMKVALGWTFKFAEGGSAKDMMNAVTSDAAKYAATTPDATAAGGATVQPTTPQSTPKTSATTTPTFTPAASATQASGQTNAVERLKAQIASQEQATQTVAGTAEATPGRYVAMARDYAKSLGGSDADAVNAWLSDNGPEGFNAFVTRDAATFKAPMSTAEYRPAQGAGGKQGAPVAWPDALTLADSLKKSFAQAGVTTAPAPGATDDTAFVQWLYDNKLGGTPLPYAPKDMKPETVAQIAQDPGNQRLRQQFLQTQGAPVTKTPTNRTVDRATQTANTASDDLKAAVEKLIKGDTSMQTKAQAQRAYSGVKLSWSPAALAAARLDPTQRKQYLDYVRGRASDMNALIDTLSLTDPGKAADLQMQINASNDPVAIMQKKAEFVKAYADLVTAGYAPQKALLELKKLGFEVDKAQADAVNAQMQASAAKLLPAPTLTALSSMQDSIQKLLSESNKLNSTNSKSDHDTAASLYKQAQSLTSLYNAALDAASKWSKDNSGIELSFDHVVIDPKTFTVDWGFLGFGAKNVTVGGTSASAPATGTAPKAPTVSPEEAALAAKYGLKTTP